MHDHQSVTKFSRFQGFVQIIHVNNLKGDARKYNVILKLEIVILLYNALNHRETVY